MKIDVVIPHTGPMDESLRIALVEDRLAHFQVAAPDAESRFPKDLPELHAELATITWPDGASSTVTPNTGDLESEENRIRCTAERAGLLAKEIRIYARCPESGLLHSVPAHLLALMNYTAPLAIRTAERHMKVSELADALRRIYAHDCINEPDRRPPEFATMERKVMEHAKLGIRLAHHAAVEIFRETMAEFPYANAFSEAMGQVTVDEIRYRIQREPAQVQPPENSFTMDHHDATHYYGHVEHNPVRLEPNGVRAIDVGPCQSCKLPDTPQIIGRMQRPSPPGATHLVRLCLNCGNITA